MTGVYNPKAFFLHAALLRQGFPHCAIFPTAASRRSLDRFSVPVWPFILSDRLLIVDLVSRYLTNYLIRRGPIPQRITPLITASCEATILCGISTNFLVLSPSEGQVAHALLTRPPLSCIATTSFDLHVLGTPPAFVLSQDQTLQFNILSFFRSASRLHFQRQLLFELRPEGLKFILNSKVFLLCPDHIYF